MEGPLTNSTLDTILAIQVTVAWAGEARCQPKRLGWWQTDLIDEKGGGDLLKRLLPRTHAWAGLEPVREAARRVDARGRLAMAEPDRVRTLFFWGFDMDERLAERLARHKRESATPSDTLPLVIPLGSAFSAEMLGTALAFDGAPAYDVDPGGRQLKGRVPDSPEQVARALAVALLPLAERYPLPFYRVVA